MSLIQPAALLALTLVPFAAGTTPPDRRTTPVDEPIAGARLTISEKTHTTLELVIENRRDVPIEAVSVDEFDDTGRRRTSLSADFCAADPATTSATWGRILPHERREFPIDARGQPPGDYRIGFVLFDDLSFEGSVAARDEVLQRRVERADEYAFVLDALDQASVKPASEVEAFLMSRKVARARQLQRLNESSAAGSPIDDAIRQARTSPQHFLAGLAAYRAHLQQALIRLRRHLSKSE